MSDETEYSESGSPIYRHAPREGGWQPASGESALEEIERHVGRYLGEIDFVYHEIVSDLVHLDVLHVKPSPERDWHTLVTSGMSDLPMTVPEGAEQFRFAELVISLPREWPVGPEFQTLPLEDERNYWPIRWLKMLARLPHEYRTWLGYGHTVPNGDPAQPFAPNTKLCCMIVLPVATAPEGFEQLYVHEDKRVHFWGLYPLYQEEVDFKLKHGADALVDRLMEAGVTDLLEPERKNTCKRSLWPF